MLYVTGGLGADAFGPDPENPEPALLAASLEEQGLAPRYAIGRLR